MKDEELSKSARAMASRGASRGGRARAEALTAADRSAIARHASEARWGRSVLTATHVGGVLIADKLVTCAVLEDGTRVINQTTLLKALGRSTRPRTDKDGVVMFAGNLRPFVSRRLAREIANPFFYSLPSTGGRTLGWKAEILPEICEVYVDASKEGVILKTQRGALEAAEILYAGLARVGITALIDEATGYQEIRAREELQQILEAYVQAELRPWIRTFPNEFFEQIYRLQGWAYRPGSSKRTPYVGHLVNKYVYEQLPPGVLDELRTRNPRTPGGYRAHKRFQFLTTDTGDPHLDRQISTVTTLMRIADDKVQFEDLFSRAFPPAQQRLPLVIDQARPSSPLRLSGRSRDAAPQSDLPL